METQDPISSQYKTSGSFNNTLTNNAKTITKCAIAAIIIFSIVAVTSFVIGIALPLTGFFLEFLSLKLAIIIAFIGLSSSLLSVAVCIGTKILDSLIINSKKTPKGIPFQKPKPTKPQKPGEKNSLDFFEEALEELWSIIIQQIKRKRAFPKIKIGNKDISKISKTSDIEKAMKNKDLLDFFKTLKYLKLQIKPEHFVTYLFRLFPNLETLLLKNSSTIASNVQKTFKQREITLKKDAFTMLKNLKTLEIESFKIKIGKNFLPRSIEEISFKNNYFKSLSNDAFNNLLKLKKVDLSENTFKTPSIEQQLKTSLFNKILRSTPPQKTSTLPKSSLKNSKKKIPPVKANTLPKPPLIHKQITKNIETSNQSLQSPTTFSVIPNQNFNSQNSDSPAFDFKRLQEEFEKLKKLDDNSNSLLL